MSSRLEMLQVARLSPKLLGDAADLTARFLQSRLNADGGFQDRSGASDLYYTVFGLEALLALNRDLPVAAVRGYLQRFDDCAALNLVHTASLARCWAALRTATRALEAPANAILATIAAYRTPDGGYHPTRGAPHGSAYGCFLVLGVYEDLDVPAPDTDGILGCLSGLVAADGGFSNQPGAAFGTTPPTAAAATLFRRLSHTPPEGLAEWLLARHRPEGGFYASPQTPIPDLLSTATALHALSGLHAPLDAIREPCLDFIDSLWSNQGGFYGHWSDEVQDCEYTYYALLALGHLSL